MNSDAITFKPHDFKRPVTKFNLLRYIILCMTHTYYSRAEGLGLAEWAIDTYEKLAGKALATEKLLNININRLRDWELEESIERRRDKLMKSFRFHQYERERISKFK